MRTEVTLLTQQATDALNALAGGSVELTNSDYTEVYLTKTLQTPAGSISAAGGIVTITIAGFPADVTFTGAGTITKTRYKNSSGTVKLDELTAGPAISGETPPDTQVDNPTVVVDQTGSIQSMTIVYS